MSNNFWIPITKDAIDQNLDALQSYLQGVGSEDEFKQSTLIALRDRANEIIEEELSAHFYSQPARKEGELVSKVRILSCFLLSGEHMMVRPFAVLLYLVMESPLVTKDMKVLIVEMMVKLMAGQTISALGFGWNDIPRMDYSLGVFATRLLGTTLHKQSNKIVMLEQKGLMEARNGNVALASMNRFDFDSRMETNKLGIAFSLYGLDVYLAKEELPKAIEFFALDDAVRKFLLDQVNVKPSPKVGVVKNLYKDGDQATVKVRNIRNGYVNTVSVDPDYPHLMGSVFYHDYYVTTYTLQMISQRLKTLIATKTIYLKVTKQDHPVTPYIMDTNFEDFYYDRADHDKETETMLLAKCIRNSGSGNEWLTEDGLVIYIKDGKYRDRTGEFAMIKVTDVDFKDATIYGDIADSIDTDVDEPNFEFVAHNNMLDSFFQETREPKEEYKSIVPLSPEYAVLASKLVARLSDERESNIEKLKHLALDRMLAIFVERNEDAAYLKFKMDFLRSTVGFAHDKSFAIPPLEIPECIASLDEVKAKSHLLDILRRYDTLIQYPEQDLTKMVRSKMDAGEIERLVEASNLLNGLVPDTSLDRIKNLIALYLGTGRQYTSIVEDKTDYGGELTEREFKSSIVFPPDNDMKPDHKRQMFNIFKAVIGLLNSDKGGDLYIGVNDTTHKAIPGQLFQDMEYLKSLNLITEMSMDKYLLYLKNKIDEAFKEEYGNAKGLDITTGRVDLIPEQSKEGVDVLHISVKPYEYDIVVFNQELYPKFNRTYIRTAAATVPMDDEMKIQSRDRKSRLGGPELDKIHKLEEAKREKFQVILKNYQSKNSTRDRYVEGYIILVNHDTLIAFDLENNENREFRLSRIGSIEVTAVKWKKQQRYRQEPRFDIFNMMDSENDPPIHIVLKLQNYAKNLLVEAYPRAKMLCERRSWFIDKLMPSSDGSDRWLLDINVYRIEGVGRFYLGLAPFIEIVEGKALKEYVENYVKDNLSNL